MEKGRGKLILVTGGSGSGKSVFAEEQILLWDEPTSKGDKCSVVQAAKKGAASVSDGEKLKSKKAGNAGRRFYIATMHPYDEESHRRIDRHRRMRAGKGFETIERYTNLSELLLPGGSSVLLECMSNLVANEMFMEEGAKEDTVEQVLLGVGKLCDQAELVVIVTNEIFSEAMTYQGDTERYQQYLGAVNCRLAALADEVVEIVYGIPIYHKKE